MLFNHILPKGMKTPELTFYKLTGINFQTAKSYLVGIPVADRTLGIEIVINNESTSSYFFIEFHDIDIPLQKVDIGFNVNQSEDTCEYYSCSSSKPSIFPFKCIEVPQWRDIGQTLKSDEELIIQYLFIKKTNPVLIDSMWSQYEDYVNGVDFPTSNKLIRSFQQQLLDVMKRLEGGYRKNTRIPETEKKLREDLFSFETRFSIRSDSENRRVVLLDKIRDVFQRHNFINSWMFSRERDKKTFAEHMQLRRFSLFRKKQYLSASEIAGLFLTEEEIPSSDPSSPIVVNSDLDTVEEVDMNPFSIFPQGSKKKRADDNKISEQLNNALRKLSLIDDEEVVVQKIQHGATVKRISFTLPEGLKLTNLKKAVADIQTELALTDISIVQGSSAGTAVLSTPQEEREGVFVRDCVDEAEFVKFSSKAHIPLLVGRSETGEVVFVDLIDIKHLLVAGSTGSGKSVFLNSLLTVMLTLVNPNDLKVFMIDPKMVELQAYSKYPHVQKVFTDMNEVEGVLCYLCEKMDERYSQFKVKGYKNIQQYNRNESIKMPYILLVIDELADLIMTNPENEDFIVRLAQKARAAGIHLIIATQRPIKEVVTGLIKANIYSRICFACDSGISYRIALDETPPFNLLGKGDGIYRFEGIQGLHRFQGALIAKTEEEQDKIIDKLASHWKTSGSKDVIDIESSRQKKTERELNEFIKLVLDTGETRITELQKIMSVRNEKVKELMGKLIDKGWIKQHKSRAKGFELLLNEEQRKQELERLGDNNAIKN